MKLIAIIEHLHKIAAEVGDVEVYEAVHEYGYTDITPKTLEELIKKEYIRFPKENRMEEKWVIGRH